MRAVYSTPFAEDVAHFVGATYAVGAIASCHLLSRGYNDVYDVRTESATRFVLRLGGRRARGEPNVEYETAFLTYLDRCGIPVAAPLAARDGRYWRMVALAEEDRAAVLFRFVPGHWGRRGSAMDAHAQGETLARIHLAGREFEGPESRYQLDLHHLLRRPLASLRQCPFLDEGSYIVLADIAARLEEHLEAAQAALAWGHCHGDCHGVNAKITDVGALGRTATFFDFDDGGPGWLAYDLAVYLWNKTLNPETMNLWPPFLDGYRSILPIAAADLDATLLFVPIRHIWWMGERAGKVAEWGLESITAEWLAWHVTWLGDWEAKHLIGRLL